MSYNKVEGHYNLKDVYKVCIENGYISKSVSYKTFAIVVRDFSQQISYKILRGYSFKIGHDLGNIRIVKDIRKGKTINWGESNKYKQLLLDQGRIPYNKETSPDGEEWHIYYVDNTWYKWVWFKDKGSKFVTNMSNYLFRACSRNRRTLGKIVEDENLIYEDYGIHS